MAEIYDFVKYQSEKEIEMYETSNIGNLCLQCPECDSQHFVVFLDNTLECSECEISIQVEWAE